MFKRTLTLVTLLLLLLAACSSPAEPETDDPVVEDAPTEVAAATEAPTTAPDPTDVPPTEEPTAEPEVAAADASLTDGIYENRFTPEGYDEFVAYFNFYENGVVYVSLYSGQQYMAGNYEIVDEPFGYDARVDVEEEFEFDPAQSMADQTIIITNFDGSEYARVGYDSTADLVVNLGSYFNKNFVHVLDSGHTSADETGVNVIEYFVPGDQYSLVALKHNGTFQDSVNTIIDGTWTRADNVFTLTDEDSGDSYTITVNDDGTAEYVSIDGETQMLEAQTVDVQLTFTGSITAAFGVMNGTTSLYTDESAVLAIEYAGTTNEFTGDWTLNDDFSLTVTLDGVDYDIPLNTETQTFGDFEFPTSDGQDDVMLVMAQVVEQAAVVYTWVGTANENVVLEMYADGTAQLNYVGLGTVTQGTWSADTSAGPLPEWTIELDETFEDEPIEVTTDFATAFFFTYKNGDGQLEEELSLSFEAYQAGQTAQE